MTYYWQPLLKVYGISWLVQYTVKSKPTLDRYLQVKEQLVTMSLSRYFWNKTENNNITAKPQVYTPMIPNNVLWTANMIEEPLWRGNMLDVLNYAAMICHQAIQYAVIYCGTYQLSV